MHSEIGTAGKSEVTAVQIAAEFGCPCRAVYCYCYHYRYVEPAATT